MDFAEKALEAFKKQQGNLETNLKDKLDSVDKLSTYYTPGVAAVSSYVSEHPIEARDYTWKRNSVAVVSDGSAVLGLGNIGPLGALPVMTGKAMLFKHFAGVDAIPIVLDVHTADEIVATVKALAPGFGGINLEDIAAPLCFEVEDRLKEALDIPVMHDDQHGTAVVVLAALINAAKVTHRKLSDCKVVIMGAGAAGTAVMKLLFQYAKPRITAVDSQGIVNKSRKDLNAEKKKLFEFTDPVKGTSLEDAMKGADIFIGVSKANLVTSDMVKSMAKKPIIIAMANPVPEIMPDAAKEAGAAVIATGRSDFPNQVNNSLAFPGIFRGALDNGVTKITDEHKIAAAEAIAGLVEHPSADKIIPSPLEKRLVPAIAKIIV